MGRLDLLRDRAFRIIDRPGRFSETARKVNEALGRPLAPAGELADRRAFESGYGDTPAHPERAPREARGESKDGTAAPVVIFTLDKQRRDADRLAQILTDAEVPFEVRSLENDPAAQAAVRRDSKGYKLPVVFVAGDVVGGRERLTNLGRAGIRKLVYG